LISYSKKINKNPNSYNFANSNNSIKKTLQELTLLLTLTMRKIKFYKTEKGYMPVKEFIDSLIDKHAQKVTWVLRLIRELDIIPKDYLKKLVNTNDIWEVRIQSGNNIFRILCFIEKDEIIILTNGFIKKTQKTPKKEIMLAEKRKLEYLSRIK